MSKFACTLMRLMIIFGTLYDRNKSEALSKEKDSVLPSRRADDYQVSLWELYHKFDRLHGNKWDAKYIESFGAKLEKEWSSDGDTIRLLTMSHPISSFPILHKLRFRVFIARDDRVLDFDPIIQIDFEKSIPLKFLQEELQGYSVLGRALRLPSVIAASKDTEGVISVELRFGEVVNYWQHLRCHGFFIKITFKKGGRILSLNYAVGTGLDPFYDYDGRVAPRPFVSRNTLVDPEYGIRCERETSGEAVFLHMRELDP